MPWDRLFVFLITFAIVGLIGWHITSSGLAGFIFGLFAGLVIAAGRFSWSHRTG